MVLSPSYGTPAATARSAVCVAVRRQSLQAFRTCYVTIWCIWPTAGSNGSKHCIISHSCSDLHSTCICGEGEGRKGERREGGRKGGGDHQSINQSISGSDCSGFCMFLKEMFMNKIVLLDWFVDVNTI